jgi:hypothetical protein
MEPAPGLKGDEETERSRVNDGLLGNGRETAKFTGVLTPGTSIHEAEVQAFER